MHRHCMLSALLVMLAIPLPADQQEAFEADTYRTSAGDLTVTFIGHGTLMFELGDRVIHIDPVSREADYSVLPKADLILITHHHGDHCDPGAIELLSREDTDLMLNELCGDRVGHGTVLGHGDIERWEGITIEAIPAYNLVHKRDNGELFHPRGEGNGYVLSFGDTRVFVAGDTENTPEMKALKEIDIAFLPMNLPYTMTPEMVADAAKAFRPKVLYPYHYGSTDPAELVILMKGEQGIEIRVREMD